MRTTLKRGVGQSAGFDRDGVNGSGNGHRGGSSPLGPVTVYRAEPPEPPTRRSVAARVAAWALFVLTMLVAGVGGGAYLYLHESVSAVAPKSETIRKILREKLKVPVAGEPAIALVVGYDKRNEEGADEPSRSDTLMLVRADPRQKTISMMSLPRDLRAEIHCPGITPYLDKINAAYSRCGEEGSVETVKALTGLPINYLITVNFRGFRQLVDKLGGVWLDVDHRYYNDQGGPGGYAVINLRPGYQRLNGTQALDFVRFRHTDSDIHRNARQQQFVRAFKDQIRTGFSVTKLPSVIEVITKNVEVGQGGGQDVGARTVLSYAALAYALPAGHVFQARIEGLEGEFDLTTSSENISKAVDLFAQPDVEAPEKAISVALGVKRKVKVPSPKQTSVTVLNGNGITGSASSASYLLSRRAYSMVYPANGVPANAPTFDYFETVVFHDRTTAGAAQAAKRVAGLFGSAQVKPMTPVIAELSNGAMLTVVVGQTFHGRLAAAPIDATPEKQAPSTAPRQDGALGLLRDVRTKVDYPLYIPKAIEKTSQLSGAMPIRDYYIDPDKKHRAVRLIYRTGGNEYWGIQQTDWKDAPILSAKNFSRTIGGRKYDLYYNGPNLHMIVLRTNTATYWVVNTLLDSLSNETMIAIAKSLRPIGVVSQ